MTQVAGAGGTREAAVRSPGRARQGVAFRKGSKLRKGILSALCARTVFKHTGFLDFCPAPDPLWVLPFVLQLFSKVMFPVPTLPQGDTPCGASARLAEGGRAWEKGTRVSAVPRGQDRVGTTRGTARRARSSIGKRGRGARWQREDARPGILGLGLTTNFLADLEQV